MICQGAFVRVVLLGLLVVASLVVPASAASPATRLTITTRLEGGTSPHTYTLTCTPAAVRGLPPGALQPLDACRAIALAGSRLYQPRLSRDISGCSYFAAPRRAVIVGFRLGRPVRTTVEVGACERPLVPLSVLRRFVVWTGD
jgi:hypothetical protein